MVGSLKLGKKAGTVLVLESALTDVLSIVGVVAMLRVATEGAVEPGQLIGGILASLLFAAVLGVLGGIGWLMILGKVRDFPNTISATIAHAFLVYGITEFLGFSGAIAVLTLGITLTNFEFMGLKRIKAINQNMEPLTPLDLAFYKEAVFLLKTYFFVYLGISIRFNEHSLSLIVGAIGLVAAIFVGRMIFVRNVMHDSDYSLRDSAMASVLAPKGLAAAVLAGVPLQYGVAGGELIRDAAYMAVLVSIAMSALLVMAFPLVPLQRLYALILKKDRA